MASDASQIRIGEAIAIVRAAASSSLSIRRKKQRGAASGYGFAQTS
jgi:hypothetical protein